MSVSDDYWILDENRNAVPVNANVWGEWFEDHDQRHVDTTTIPAKSRLLWWLGLRPDYWVSTIFLGLDHSFGPGPPLLFETMVFRRWPRWKSYLSSQRISKAPPWWLRPLYRKLEFAGMTTWPHRFDNWSEWSELDTERYSTWNEASQGHKDMVDKWTKIANG